MVIPFHRVLQVSANGDGGVLSTRAVHKEQYHSVSPVAFAICSGERLATWAENAGKLLRFGFLDFLMFPRHYGGMVLGITVAS